VINKAIKYVGDVKKEMAKVHWPSKMELRDSSVIVVVLSLLMAIFIFVNDTILNFILKMVLR